MKQTNRKGMKSKNDTLIVILALLGLFNIALSASAVVSPREMGMGKSMGTTGEQPITDELVEIRAKVARLEAALEKNWCSYTKPDTHIKIT